MTFWIFPRLKPDNSNSGAKISRSRMHCRRSSPLSVPWRWQKNIQVHHKLEGDRAVYADRVRFKQILYNLLSNAVKFTPKDGRIDIDCVEKESEVCILVTD